MVSLAEVALRPRIFSVVTETPLSFSCLIFTTVLVPERWKKWQLGADHGLNIDTHAHSLECMIIEKNLP